MKNTVWVLTSEYNDYDQHGCYFIAVFKDKPTAEQLLREVCYTGEEDLIHLLNGGGRRKYEDFWYNLDEEDLL